MTRAATLDDGSPNNRGRYAVLCGGLNRGDRVEGAVGGYFERKKVRNKIDKLNEHYILGGFGRVGRHIAQELAADGVPFIVID